MKLDFSTIGTFKLEYDDDVYDHIVSVFKVIPSSRDILMHRRESYGFEYTAEVDTNGNVIHWKDTWGTEKWFEYDSNNNVIHRISSEFDVMSEDWYTYTADGVKLTYVDKRGHGYWYSSNGNEITEDEYNKIHDITIEK